MENFINKYFIYYYAENPGNRKSCKVFTDCIFYFWYLTLFLFLSYFWTIISSCTADKRCCYLKMWISRNSVNMHHCSTRCACVCVIGGRGECLCEGKMAVIKDFSSANFLSFDEVYCRFLLPNFTTHSFPFTRYTQIHESTDEVTSICRDTPSPRFWYKRALLFISYCRQICWALWLL